MNERKLDIRLRYIIKVICSAILVTSVLQCAGAGFWGLRSNKSFKDTLLELILEAGDADTNGAA
jgi:hypothetical protein